MPVHLSARRRLLAASAAALLPMQRALAQTRQAGGDWLEMVRVHQAMIVRSLEQLIEGLDEPPSVRRRLARMLSYQLGAHVVAEENAILPVLQRHGLADEAGRLHAQQQLGRERQAQLLALAQEDADVGQWVDRLRALESAVLLHAREHEDGFAYPKLRQKLDARENAALAEAYQREFTSVRGRS